MLCNGMLNLEFIELILYSFLYMQSTKEEIQTAISTALKCGYRHFDCAYAYLNEDAIGEVFNEWITAGKIKREELFIVTKVKRKIHFFTKSQLKCCFSATYVFSYLQ